MKLKLKTGQSAPDFKLPDQNNKLRRLKDYQGQWALLYFYPKDDTEGCTVEACGLAEHFLSFVNIKAEILGLSVDSVQSHKKFANKYKLPFTLLSDEKKSVVKKYGVWQEKNMMGKKYWGTARASFLINPKGKIAKIYPKVEPERHAEEVLHDMQKLIKS